MQKNWQEIENILLGFPNYNCFVCSPSHSTGFCLKFYYDPDSNLVVSPVNPQKEERAGFPNILHGGFQAMVLDEVMFWAVIHFHKKISFTSSFEIEYLKTVYTQQPFLLKSRVTRNLRNKLFEAESWIEQNNEIPAKAKGRYITLKTEHMLTLAGDKNIPEKFKDYLCN